MGSSKKVFKGVSWSIIYNILNSIYGFIAVPILINFYGKGHYGLIGIALSVNIYVRLMDMGLNSTNIRFFSSWLAEGKKERIKIGFQTTLMFYTIVGLINAIILIFVALYAGSIFNVTGEKVEILRNLFLILTVSAIVSWYSSSFDQLIRATENVDWIQRCSILIKLAQIAALGLAVWLQLKIEIYFALTIISTFIILPLSIKKIREELPFISFKPKWDKTVVKEILPYCINVFSFSIFQFTFWNLRPILLGIGSTAESVADFRIMNGIAGIIVSLSGSFLGALLPSVSKAVAQGNKDAYFKVAYDGTKYITIFLSLLCFGLMTISPSLLTLYVGIDYLYLVPWLNIWAICLLGYSNQAISSLIFAGTNLKPLAINSAIASILGLLAVWFLIPYFDVGAAVIGHAVYTVAQQLFYYLKYWPTTLNIDTKRVFFKCVSPSVVVGGVCFLVSRFITPIFESTIFEFFVSGSIFTVLFCVCSMFLLSKIDRSYLLDQVKNKNRIIN